jgi:hypothetical protein
MLLGGATMILINVIVTPLLPRQEGSGIVMTTGIFLLRQSASALAALLLLFGSLGLHLARGMGSGVFAKTAFLVSFVGCAFLFAVEWTNVFVLRAVAQSTPAALDALDRTPLFNTGFASAAGLFALGWLLLSVGVWRARVFPRWAAVTTMAGLVSTPALQATPLGIGGAIAGNVVFGVGLMGLGRALAIGPTDQARRQGD